MNHAMIDTETWGSLPGSAIRSIGGVMFDPETGQLGGRFYVNIDDASCLAAGLVQMPDTVAWWAEQSAEAQAAFDDPRNPRAPLAIAMTMLADWWKALGAKHLWCHGAGFDEPILRLAFLAVGQRAPWAYWDVRDTRTVYDLAEVKPDKAAGRLHHALDDAERQAKAVIEAYGRLNRRLGSGATAEAPVSAFDPSRFAWPRPKDGGRLEPRPLAVHGDAIPELVRAVTTAIRDEMGRVNG